MLTIIIIETLFIFLLLYIIAKDARSYMKQTSNIRDHVKTEKQAQTDRLVGFLECRRRGYRHNEDAKMLVAELDNCISYLKLTK